MHRNPTPDRVKQRHLMLGLVELRCRQGIPAFRQKLASFRIPGGTLKQRNSLDEPARTSTTPCCAARILAGRPEFGAPASHRVAGRPGDERATERAGPKECHVQ
jgi:hypothetical protein